MPYFCYWNEEFLHKHLAYCYPRSDQKLIWLTLLYREEPIVIVTMPGTFLPLPYQLSDAKERAEREHERLGESHYGEGTFTQVQADDINKERVQSLFQIFYSLQPGMPPPRELLDSNTAIVRSASPPHSSLSRWLTHHRAELIQCEILVTKSYWSKREAYFREQNERARRELGTIGYTILRNLVRAFPPAWCSITLTIYHASFQRNT